VEDPTECKATRVHQSCISVHTLQAAARPIWSSRPATTNSDLTPKIGEWARTRIIGRIFRTVRRDGSVRFRSFPWFP